MRWLARPTRCSSRDTPLGAPTWITWSMPPQSMPRSSEEVAITPRSPSFASEPRAIAASTRRRWPTSRLPWCSAIGRVSSLMRQIAANSSSDCARVLTNTMVMPDAAIRSRITEAPARPMRPDHGTWLSGSIIDSAGGAPGGATTIRAGACGVPT